MTRNELSRLEMMQAIQDRRLTQKKAAQALGLSVRHVKRLYRAYREMGPAGLVSGRRGKPSNHRLDPSVVKRARDLLEEKYHDFGPTLACEKLREVHGLRMSAESVRKLMIAKLCCPTRIETKWPRNYATLLTPPFILRVPIGPPGFSGLPQLCRSLGQTSFGVTTIIVHRPQVPER